MNDHLLASINIAAIFLPALIAVLTFRGFFRAWAAKLMGDNTAKEEGFLSLNPVAHIDLFGLLIILFVLLILGSFLHGGLSYALLLIVLIFMGARWSYEVPINENNFKNLKKGMIFLSLAGFIGNCFLALLFLYIGKYFPFASLPAYAQAPVLWIFSTIIDLSLFFGVFNLLPIPPFDGSVLLSYLLPRSSYNILQKIEEYSLFILIVLLLFGEYFFGAIHYLVLQLKFLLSLLVI